MGGLIAFQGGGPFEANDGVDRRLLAERGIDRIVVMPTADAYEQPRQLVETALEWAARIGVIVEPLMVLVRSDATEQAAAVIDAAPAVFLAGDSGNHLRSVLKDTPVLASLRALVERGGTLIAAGASAAALCDPMTDERGGGFGLGLGLVTGIAVIPNVERVPHDQLERARQLATTPLLELATGTTAVLDNGEWAIT